MNFQPSKKDDTKWESNQVIQGLAQGKSLNFCVQEFKIVYGQSLSFLEQDAANILTPSTLF